MTMRMICLLVFLTLAAACSRVEEQVVSALFQNYLSAQTALANDNYPAAQKALQALAKEADEKIQVLAKEVADCEDIDTAREKFSELSKVVANLPLPEAHVVAFCPMANEGEGASWVQKQGEIRNPYYGAEMLTCGEITKTN